MSDQTIWELTSALARVVSKSIPAECGFALILLEKGTNVNTYATNVDLADMTLIVRELCDHIDAQQEQ